MAENNVAAQAGDEPIPCPFCGGAPQVVEDYDDRGNQVIECAGCAANVGANNLSAGWARWNQRVVTPRATADVEQLVLDLSKWTGEGGMTMANDFVGRAKAILATTKPGA